MRRMLVVAFAIFATALMVSAQPAAAADAGLEVGSQHTDFGTGTESSPTTLDNATISGSGDAAKVEFGTAFEDGFEDEPADSGLPGQWENVTAPANPNVTDVTAADGAQSAYMDEAGNGAFATVRPAEQPYGSNRTQNVSVALQQQKNASAEEIRAELHTGGTRAIVVGMRGGDLQYYDGSWHNISTTPDAGEWVDLTIYDIDPSTDTFAVEWSTATGSGTATGLNAETGLDSGYDELWIGANKNGGFYDAVRLNGEATGTYVSANHSADRAEEAAINLTATGSDVTATIEGWDGSSWVDDASATYSTGGNKTLALSGSYSKWRTRVDFQKTKSSGEAAIADESILFNASDPIVSSTDPSEGEKVDSFDGTLDVDINDSDFGTAQGDTVTVTAKHDNGTVIGSGSRSSNGTVSISYNEQIGENAIEYELEDSYGEITVKNGTFYTPAEISFYNESSPGALVTEVNVTVRFFDGSIVEKNTSDGTVRLDGLPASKSITVVAEADGYYSRTVLLKSVYQQQQVFLLNESTSTAVEVRFKLDDKTGSFPESESKIVIEKPITKNGSTDYRIIAADEFGVNGFATFLESNQRYQLSVKNREGDSRTVGHYGAPTSETVTVTVGELTFGTRESDEWSFETGYLDSSTAGSGKKVVFNFSDPAGDTTDLRVIMHEHGNESNELLNRTYDGPFGTHSVSQDVPEAENSTQWVVKLRAERGGGLITGQQAAGPKRNLVPELDPFWKRATSILLLFMTMGLFSRVNAAGGIIITSLMAGMLWQTGMMPGMASGAAIMISVGVGVWLKYSQQQPVP